MIDEDLLIKLRHIQAKKIQEGVMAVSLSAVINEVLKKSLK